jgi:hypothetical protein
MPNSRLPLVSDPGPTSGTPQGIEEEFIINASPTATMVPAASCRTLQARDRLDQ